MAVTYFISQIVLKVLKSKLNEDDASETFYRHFSINGKHLDDVRRAVNRNMSSKCLSHPAAKVPFKCHVESLGYPMTLVYSVVLTQDFLLKLLCPSWNQNSPTNTD